MPKTVAAPTVSETQIRNALSLLDDAELALLQRRFADCGQAIVDARDNLQALEARVSGVPG
jgi:hypothetical protein